MRIKAKLVATSVLAGALSLCLFENDAQAQIPPIVERDPNWDAVSSVSMMIGVASVSLMPRVYYSSPDATVGWKARWHISSLAPVMTFAATTAFVNGPLRDTIQSPKQGCSLDDTLAQLPDSGCEAFGGPSTHAYAAWGAFGYGAAVWAMDTFYYSDFEWHTGSFIGNVAIPLGAAFLTSAARSADGRGFGPESTGQVVAGALPGLGIGAIVGLGYALMQEPDCGYGGYLFCW